MSLALGINPVYSFESQAYFLEHILPQDYRVVVVLDESTSRPVAFMASSEFEINQLYVSSTCQGLHIGSCLVNLTKKQSKGSLVLRTFDVNQRAKDFNQSHGFTFKAGNRDNEEGLPDIECHWTR
ncbi:GNAT family N-acetyltransferase [Vibrio fluvialis]|nr:GNAT family N-acetyltransferase [Vibrio fluvialis]